MPKKTKKEKIIAQYRRKLQSVREIVSMSPERIKEASTPQQTHLSSPYVYQAKNSVSAHTVVAVQSMDRAIRRDLVKTLILAAVAIGGEVALSMVMGK